MRVGVGVSTGSEVVCAALVVTEDDGSSTVEYRTVSADCEANTDVGDLVASAIELMTSLTPARSGQSAHASERSEPDAIAVSYRTPEQAASIRAAIGQSNRDISLIPESAAAHAFLADSGLVARYRAVAVVDIGASGSTTSIIDAQTGAVQAYDRTEHFSGDVINGLVKDIVYGLSIGDSRVRDDLRDDRGIGSARYRTVKEQLSTHDEVAVDHTDGPVTVDRARFEAAVRPYVTSAAHVLARMGQSQQAGPEAIVLIGGGAYIPLVSREFETLSGLPVLAPTEPDTILAKGAAYLALSAPHGMYPSAGSSSVGAGRSVGRYSAVLAGALLIGGIVLAYGVQALTPAGDSEYAPAGAAVTNEPQTTENRPIVDEGAYPTEPVRATTTARSESSMGGSASPEIGGGLPSTTAPSTTRPLVESTPTLHPAPDLPVIPWPAQETAPLEMPTPVVTTTTTPAPPVTENPDQSTTPPPTTTPETPGTSPTTTPSPTTVPTTDVNGPPTSPELTPPPTVWSPPAPVPESALVPDSAPAGDAPTESTTASAEPSVRSAEATAAPAS